MAQKNSSRFFNIETKWLVLVAIGIGTFMSALDGSVVNTILPVVTNYWSGDMLQQPPKKSG